MYRSQLPVVIVEALFAMHSISTEDHSRRTDSERESRRSSGGESSLQQELLGWAEFVKAVEYTRLKVKKIKTRSTSGSTRQQQQVSSV